MRGELSVVGKSVKRVDAYDKVTGRAKYTSEAEPNLPGLLHGKVLYSPYPHARIIAIDTSKAKRLPGVRAVLTGKDVTIARTGQCIHDQHILAQNNVRFAGNPVAVVAADTIEIAEEALDLVKAEYEVLPAVFNAEEAMQPDCPVVIHPDLATYNRPIYKYLGRDLPGPNVHTHHKVRKGNIEEGFKNSDLLIENRYSTARMAHGQMEPANAIAYMESDGTLVVYSSEKQIYTNRQIICNVFSLPFGKVRVKSHYIGGAFGATAKADLFAVLLALKTGKPVKMVFTREETFLRDPNRLPQVIYIKDGVKRDGTLIAREMRLIGSGGAYSEQTPLLLRNGSFGSSQYRIPNFKWDSYGVYTNEPPCGALRGFGNSQPFWAIEQQMDIIAEKLNIDPVELRQKNLIKEGEENLRGEITHSIGALECLTKAAQGIGWNKKENTPLGNVKIGKGIALANKYTRIDTVSAATVKVYGDGTLEVRHGSDEIGQGANTVLGQIAAEEFGAPMEKVRVIWGDTAIVPWDHGAISSRTTMYAGNAIRLACQDARMQLFRLATSHLGVSPQEMEIINSRVCIRKSPEKSVAIGALFLPEAKGGQREAMSMCLANGAELVGKGTFMFTDIAEEDPETGQGKRLTASYCYTAQAVEVAVDTETGVVKILRLCAACDMGLPVNPQLCEGQVQGGAAMGIGSTLYEEVVLDKGALLTPNFIEYKMPGIKEIPMGDDFKTELVLAPHREGPFGAKGGGEALMTPTAPAIANAIYNAVGVRIMDLPITPEKVLKALKENSKF